MFVDSVELLVSSGKGGAGCVSFWTEKFVIKGGPDGGDGGKGGSIYFKVDNNRDTLSAFRGKKHIKAENGRPGEGRKRYGRKGKSVEIVVPAGTQVIDIETNEILLDLVKEGEKVLFLEGGKGGLGNTHFKSSTNQRPTYAQPGLPGVTKHIRLEMKLIADVGLVGYPSVGKSTLISTISNSKPKIASYEFTTLIPNLGVVNIGEYDSFVVADIPGIIEGASSGKGLGLKFLKHIERTKTLLLMVDILNYRDMKYQYETLLIELKRYSKELASKRFAIAISKCDSLSIDEINSKIKSFLEDIGLKENNGLEKFGANMSYLSYGFIEDFGVDLPKDKPLFVIPISSISNLNIKPLSYALKSFIKKSIEEQKERDEV